MATSSHRDPLLNLLKMEKELFMSENAHLSPLEQEQQWTARTTELTAALGSTAATNPFLSAIPAAKVNHYARRTATLPSTTTGMARSHSDLPPTHFTRQPQEGGHFPSAFKKRSISSQNGPCPFTGTGGAIPSTSFTTRRADNDAIRQYQSNTDDPFSPLKTRRLSKPEKMVDCAVYDDPSTFYKSVPTSPMSLSPSSINVQTKRRPPPLQSVSPLQPQLLSPLSALSQSPATESLSSFTPPTSVSLSRQNSSIPDLSMMRINSQFSNGGSDPSLSANESSFPIPFEDQCQKAKLPRNRAFDPQHKSGSLGRAQQAWCQPPSLLPASFDQDTVMKRSISMETTQSAASNASNRSLESSSSGTRKLAPKVPIASLPVSRQSSSSGHEVIRQRSADGSVKEVVSIVKTPYVRPQHAKIKCSQCHAKPDGFRGEHELRRHTERAHAGTLRTVFVCIDISPDMKFLSNCKACTANKRYNAYYNAAAHLRRVHFNPKEKGVKGKTKPKESRGGKGGGDWPPMDVVKEWMTEIEEMVSPNAPFLTDDNEPEDDNTSNPVYNSGEGQPTVTDHQRLDNNQIEETSHFDTPNSKHALSAAPALSLSAPNPLPPYDSLSLHLSQPHAGQSASFLDLSFDVSSNEPGELALWEMSPVEDPQLMDFQNTFSFPDCS